MSSSVARGLFVVLGALSFETGCVKNVAQPRCPAHGGLPWYEATTKHFVVRTDMEQNKIRATVEELERGYSELAAAAFPRGVGNAERLTLVLLHDQREVSEYWPMLGGFSAERLGGDIEHAPTLVFAGAGYPPAVRMTFLHELTHRFVAYTYGPTPMWLNEGLAMYYSTLRVENGKMILGDVVPGAYAPAGVAPSVRELLAANQSTFYANDVAIPYRREEVRALYYSAAFAFVHYLSNGPANEDDLLTRFRLLKSSLGEGKSFVETWPKTLGEVPLETLEREYLQYVGNWSWDRFVHDAPKLDVAPMESIRQLADYEIDLEWARLLWGDKDTRPLAKTALEAASSHAPDSPEVAYVAGSHALQAEPAEARARFHDALEKSANDPRFLYGYALALHREWRGKPMPEDTIQKLHDTLTRLEKVARTTDELSLVADYHVASRDLEAARLGAEKAIAIDPGYFGGRVTRAMVYFASNRFAEAVADQERAISLLPDGVSAHGFLVDLAKYRAARDAAPK